MATVHVSKQNYSSNISSSSTSVLPSPTGPYTVGCIDISIEDYPLIRFYYPTTSTETVSSFSKWMPHLNYTEAYLDFLNIRQVKFSSHISRQDITEKINDAVIPAIYGAPLFTDHKDSKVKFPVVIFSHGRGGMRTRYSGTCCDLASHGYVVAVPEHCDGSSCIALKQMKDSNGEIYGKWIPYTLDKGENESEFEFRNNQVMKRVSELQETRQLLCLLNQGSPLVNMFESNDHFDLLQFKDCILLDNIALIGHSFGGATIIQALSSITSSESSDSIFKCGIALDPWMMPLSESVFNEESGIKQPLLFVNSSHYYQTPESIGRIMKLIKPPNREGISHCQLITIDGTVHLSQVDSAFILSDYFQPGGKDKPTLQPSISHDINMRLCHAFLKRFLTLADNHQINVPLLDRRGECSGDSNKYDKFIIYETNID